MQVLLSEVLNNCRAGKKTGALFVLAVNSKHLVRFYFQEGEVYSLTHGQLSGNDCLAALIGVNYSTAVFFDRLRTPLASARNMPETSDIIETLRSLGRMVEVSTSYNVKPVGFAPSLTGCGA